MEEIRRRRLAMLLLRLSLDLGVLPVLAAAFVATLFFVGDCICCCCCSKVMRVCNSWCCWVACCNRVCHSLTSRGEDSLSLLRVVVLTSTSAVVGVGGSVTWRIRAALPLLLPALALDFRVAECALSEWYSLSRTAGSNDDDEVDDVLLDAD